ncbi:MAG: TIGR02611 family protein [Candidatus Microsaccharimonas sp.]
MAFHHHVRRHTKRILTGIIGALVVLVGIVMIPYPGPGWLVVFAGFAILATEFEFASKTLEWLKDKYETWVNWLKRQHVSVQVTVLAFTGLVVLVTVWLLNGPGSLNNILHLNQEWLISPLFR